jgi:hypothetical protein
VHTRVDGLVKDVLALVFAFQLVRYLVNDGVVKDVSRLVKDGAVTDASRLVERSALTMQSFRGRARLIGINFYPFCLLHTFLNLYCSVLQEIPHASERSATRLSQFHSYTPHCICPSQISKAGLYRYQKLYRYKGIEYFYRYNLKCAE